MYFTLNNKKKFLKYSAVLKPFCFFNAIEPFVLPVHNAPLGVFFSFEHKP